MRGRRRPLWRSDCCQADLVRPSRSGSGCTRCDDLAALTLYSTRVERIGRYEVVRELGHGGMGSVYLGRDPELRRSVALKLLHRANSGHQLKQEARALAALNHPGIVTIFEIGEHDGAQFIAMEFLDGVSLRTLLAGTKPSRDQLVAICAKVATAVEAAHTAGILHRDIKP